MGLVYNGSYWKEELLFIIILFLLLFLFNLFYVLYFVYLYFYLVTFHHQQGAKLDLKAKLSKRR